jgi:hypothetical protein
MPFKLISSFIFCVSIFGCYQVPEKTQSLPYAGLESKPNERQRLIEALQNLKAVFASRDPEKIGRLFHFPVPDTVASLFVDDSTYKTEKNKNNNELTRVMYDHYFNLICKDWQLDEMDQLFRHIPLLKLNEQDTISYFAGLKDPCLKQYFISVDDSLVSIMYGTNHNDKYKSKDKEEDDAGDACEYDTIWIFQFDGETLHLVRQSAAG